MSRRSPTIYFSLAAGAAALGSTAWHIARNIAPPSWDDAWYLETSFRLWNALKISPSQFLQTYESAFRIKAPLISLLPLPLYAAFGPGERIAVWINLPLAALGAWAWSRAAAQWWKDHPRAADIAALGGALAALLPISYGLSRLFFTETCVGALLGLLAWRCAAAQESSKPEGPLLGLLFGLGCLAKVTFPLLSAGFVWHARRRLAPHAKAALLVATAVAASWYAVNAPTVLGFAWSSGFGKIAQDYAGRGGLLARIDWASALIHHDLSWPLTAAMAATVALSAAMGERLLDAGTINTLWGLCPLAAYAVGVNTDVRLPAPLLPIAGLLTARAANAFRNRWSRAASALLVLSVGLGVCLDQTFRAGPGRAFAYNGEPSRDAGWDRLALVDSSARAAGPDGVVAVAFEHRSLNANNLSSLAASRGMSLSFVSLGYGQQSLEGALIRLKEKNARALIMVDGYPSTQLPKFLNAVNGELARAVAAGRLKARDVDRVALAPGISARLLRLDR